VAVSVATFPIHAAYDPGKLFRTAVFECSRSGSFRIVLGILFFALFGIGTASQP
jgi:hypothetical protein